MGKEPEQLPMAEAQAPAGTYQFLMEHQFAGSKRTKRFVSVEGEARPNVRSVLVTFKEGRGNYPLDRYTFNIDSSNLVTELTGLRYVYQGKDAKVMFRVEKLSPDFEDIMSVINYAYRRLPK